MQSNQLTEALQTVVYTPAGIQNTIGLRFVTGLVIAGIVAIVVLGGINRIGKVASRLVPFMVGYYFLLVLYIIVTNLGEVPGVLLPFSRMLSTGKQEPEVLSVPSSSSGPRAAFVNEAE